MILNEKIDAYIDSLLPEKHPVLTEMEEEAKLRDFPIIDRQGGMFLYLIAKSIGAKRVLELGSGYGYSALWFSLALGEKGRIDCTEYSAENITEARAYLKKAEVKTDIRFHQGDALKSASALTGPYDIIFNDIDKELYPETIAVAERLLKPGGLFLTDNAFWLGNIVVQPPYDAPTESVLRFNAMLQKSEAFETTIVPIRDGISYSRKL